jgi:hypothetical protein
MGSRRRKKLEDGRAELDLEDGEWMRVEVPVTGDLFWWAYALFARHDDRDVLVELRIFPGTGHRYPFLDDYDHATAPEIGTWSGSRGDLVDMPADGITARLLRDIRLTDLTARMQRERYVIEFMHGMRDRMRTRDARDVPVRPGRAGKPDIYYARWARRYVERLSARSPIAELAAEHGLKPEQVRDVIHEARVRELLTKGSRGKAGGALTEKALKLLKSNEAEQASE